MLSSFVVGINSMEAPSTSIARMNSLAFSEDSLTDLKSQSWMDSFTSNIYVLCFTIYGMWILCGILWYHFYDGWTTSTAYYYSMDAGLSIGFCNPAEKDDWSKLFTIFYVLLGSSTISGSLGVFASMVIFTKVNVMDTSKGTETITLEDIRGNITVRSFFLYMWYLCKWSLGWYSNRSRTIIIGVFIIWMGLGTVYGMVVEKWSFITALYWAITSTATGGLQSAPCVNSDDDNYTRCNMGNFRGSIMGVFFMFGVPIYACTVGQFAKIAVQRAVATQEAQLLNRPIEDNEFIFAANILSPEGSETLVCGEYILLELMRLGKTNQSQIEEIKRNFYRLDRNNTGEINIHDLRRIGKVITKPPRVRSIVGIIRTRSIELFQSNTETT